MNPPLTAAPSATARLARALVRDAWLEVMPFGSAEDQLARVTRDVPVTVTASPRHGLEQTVATAERLSAAGFRVVPHLSARMVSGRERLRTLLARLGRAGVVDLFVVGGDAVEQAGPYADALALLRALRELDLPLREVGIAGYPEDHPGIAPETLLAALLEKQPLATYLATQICFQPAAIVSWAAGIRAAGVRLPIRVGVPGVVDRRRLVEISARVGVGRSLRHLVRHRRTVGALVREGSFDPTPFVHDLAAQPEAAGLDLAGLHVFTFNAVDRTADWRTAFLASTTLDSTPQGHQTERRLG